MKKIIKTFILSCSLALSITGSAIAAQNDSSALKDYEVVAETSNNQSIYGTETNQEIRASNAVAVCTDYMQIDKKFLKNQWRTVGETIITPTVTWEIAMELELFKNGHIATTASKTKSNTSYYSTHTKWVSGKQSDDWTAEGIFRVFDDNGSKIHEQELYID